MGASSESVSVLPKVRIVPWGVLSTEQESNLSRLPSSSRLAEAWLLDMYTTWHEPTGAIVGGVIGAPV
jgi:hypothetical protein